MTLPALHMGRAGMVSERDKERNMANTLATSGANSVSYLIDTAGTLGQAAWAALSDSANSNIKSLLNTSYASVDAFFAAFAAAGAVTTYESDVATQEQPFWSLSGGASGYPVVNFLLDGGATRASLRISRSYSASA